MVNNLVIHLALLIERTNYCVDCSWKVGWGEKKKNNGEKLPSMVSLSKAKARRWLYAK